MAKWGDLPVDLDTDILIISLVGVYVATQSPLNFIVVVSCGFFGLLMKRYGYSRPALLLGFVLGGLFEKYTLLSIKMYGPLFFLKPLALVLVVITILILNYSNLKKLIILSRRRLKRA